jgi:hypothetical protein
VLVQLLRLVTLGRSQTHAITIGGWTPGMRCLVAGRLLSCGCLVGVYHTVSEDEVEIIDNLADGCAYGHSRNLILRRRGIADNESEIAITEALSSPKPF